MIDYFLNYCSKFIQFTELDKEAIELNFKPIKLKRKDFLLKEGMFCDFVAFLNSGVIRHYHIKDDNQMKSTGESIYFIDSLQDEYFQDIYSSRNLYLSK